MRRSNPITWNGRPYCRYGNLPPIRSTTTWRVRSCNMQCRSDGTLEVGAKSRSWMRIGADPRRVRSPEPVSSAWWPQCAWDRWVR